MWRITEGTARDIWYQIVLWSHKPEFVVDASIEVDVDNTIAKPMNLLFYKKRAGFPCGHNIREIIKETHDKWRPFFLRLVRNPLKIWKRGAKALTRVRDSALRELLRKRIYRAAAAAQQEFTKLFKCVYQDHMLYLWMWYPKFARSAARCLGLTVGLRCTPPAVDNDNDQFLLKEFNACKNNVVTLWKQFDMLKEEEEEIM